ncbi:DoxX family protein [Falsiroseomonas sp.]|uniref:DoxX family protein n=1 Tax=Falsiroseomonas sp. TaxID=2870721 RepID=UPI003F7169D8
MLFFALLGLATLAAALADRLGAPGLGTWPARMRWGLAAALVFFGIDHLAMPGRYLPMIEGLVPWPGAVIMLTGLCEVAGAIGLLVPRLRRAAGILLAVYFVCVFPANIRNALQGLAVEGLPAAGWYYWARLPLQPLAIWWSLRAAEVIAWPRRSRA